MSRMPVRSSLIVLALAAGWSAASAQNPISAGPVLGLNLANWGGADTEGADTKTRAGLMLGGVVSFGLGGRVSFQPGLVYTQKGLKFDDEDNQEVDIKLSYFEVPALFQVRFPSGNVAPYFVAGPAFGFKLSCAASAGPVSIDCDEADLLGIASSDLSLIGGVGLEVQQLSFELRYDYSLSKVSDENDEIYNRVITLAAGYRFRIR